MYNNDAVGHLSIWKPYEIRNSDNAHWELKMQPNITLI